MPNHFVISEQCSPEQRKIFEAVNRGLDVIGISADEFDTYFRLFLMQACLRTADSAFTGIYYHADPQVRHSIFTVPGKEQEMEAMHEGVQRILTTEGMLRITSQGPLNNPQRIINALMLASQMKPYIATALAENLSSELGRFQDFDPAKLTTADQRQRYEEYAAMVAGTEKPDRITTTNLLQTFANGKPIFNDGNKSTYWTNIPNIRMETGASSSYIHLALLQALTLAAGDKNKLQALTADQGGTNAFLDIAKTVGENIEHMRHVPPPEEKQLAEKADGAQTVVAPVPEDVSPAAPSIEKHKAWAEKYKATDKAFTINPEEGALTIPQRQYYEKLNEVIALLGVSPKEFDDQFRFSVAHCAMADAEKAVEILINRYKPQYVTADHILKNRMQRFCGGYESPVLPKVVYNSRKVFLKEREEQLYKYTLVSNVENLLDSLDSSLGTLNIKQDDKGDLNEKAALTLHKAAIGKIGKIIPGSDDESVQHLSKADKVSTEENILQSYASGERSLRALHANPPPNMKSNVYTATFASSHTYFDVGTARAIHSLIAKKLDKDIDKEKIVAIQQRLEEMLRLSGHGKKVGDSQAVLWMSGDELANAERKAQKRTAALAVLEKEKIETAKREEERQRRLQEAASKPKPYGPVTLPKGSREDVVNEVNTLCAAMDCRMETHQQLGDALFGNELLKLISAVAGGQPGNINVALDPAKNKGITQALKATGASIERLLATSEKDIPPDQRAQHKVLVNTLLESPIILSCVTGKRKLIMALPSWEDARATRKYVATELLPELGIVLGGVKQKPPTPPLAPSPQKTITSATEQEKGSPTADAPVVPIAAVAAGAIGLLKTPSAPPQEKPPEQTTPVISPADKGKTDTPPSSSVETVAVPAETILKNDPTLLPAELEERRRRAYQAMARQLAADAEIAGIRAVEDGYNQFRCDLLVDKTHARIRLLFRSDDPGKQQREEIFDLNSNRYINGFARLGVIPTTFDATNLHIIINGEIAASGDFLPILSKTSTGKPRVSKDDFIPNLAIDPDKRKTEIKVGSDGMYQLRLTSRFTKNSEDVTIVFQLGVQENRTDEEKNAEAQTIAEARAKIITDFIDSYNPNPARRRKVPKKGEIQEHLETEVLKVRNADINDPRGQWAYPDSIPLFINDGLERHYLKLTDPNYEQSSEEEQRKAIARLPRVVVYDEDWRRALVEAGEHQYREIQLSIPALDTYPSEQHRQKTTLGAIALNKTGSNRTYRLDFDLHVNDGTVTPKRRESAAGYNIRTRSMDLCIEDPTIASRRAQQVFFGHGNTMGLADMLTQYFAQRPQARWALQEKQSGSEDVAEKKLTENLDKETRGIIDSAVMEAYRRMLKNDLPINDTRHRRLHVVRDKPQHGVVAIHARIEDELPQAAGSAHSDKQYVLARDSDGRNLEVVFSVPENKADLVEKFVRGDMDYTRLNVLVKDLILRFEHDLCVRAEQGETCDGKIPVTFSVMRGRRDGTLEQHLDKEGKPVRTTLLVPEAHKGKIDTMIETVDAHLGLLAALHYSPITPSKPFAETLDYNELLEGYKNAKTQADGFTDKKHPDFNANKPKSWLAHAVNSNRQSVFGTTHGIEIVDTPGQRRAGNGGAGHRPDGARERFPSALQEALKTGSLEPAEFTELLNKKPRRDFRRGV